MILSGSERSGWGHPEGVMKLRQETGKRWPGLNLISGAWVAKPIPVAGYELSVL